MNLYKLNWNYMLHNTAVRNSYQLYNAENDKAIIIKRSSYAEEICKTCSIPMIQCEDLAYVKEYKKEVRNYYLNFDPNCIDSMKDAKIDKYFSHISSKRDSIKLTKGE